MTSTRPLISVVVPVYNTAEYLDECVTSLLEQSLGDLEIILVNDGSPDHSPRMIEEWAKRDGRIRTVHQANQGLPAARNSGMAVASGSYVGFVDSDDWVSPTMYETLLDAISEGEADVAMCDYQTVAPQGQVKKTSGIRAGQFDRDAVVAEIFPTLIMDEALEGPDVLSVWRCLYRRDFLLEHGIVFDGLAKYSEDYLFSLAIMLRAGSFAYAKGTHEYFYRFNPESISRTVKDDSWQTYVYLNKAMEKEIQAASVGASTQQLDRQLQLHMLYFALNTSNRVFGSTLPRQRKIELLREIVRSERLHMSQAGLVLPRLHPVTRVKVGLMRMRAPRLVLAFDETISLLRRFR